MRIRSAIAMRMKGIRKIARRRRRQSSVAVALLLYQLPNDTEFLSRYHFQADTDTAPSAEGERNEATDLPERPAPVA